MDNEKSSSTTGVDYTMSAAGYEDDSKQNAIYVLVGDYGDYNVTNEIVEYVLDDMDYEKKTINGHDGYLVQQNTTDSSALMETEQPVYMFVYEENGDLVFIGATDESYFGDFFSFYFFTYSFLFLLFLLFLLIFTYLFLIFFSFL